MRKSFLALAAALLMGVVANAAPVDHYSVTDLLKMTDGLKKEAMKSGSASKTLAEYNGHHTMLAYRNKDGQGEVHTQYADVFYIVRGKATLVTEGKLTGGKEESPGELRGSGVEGGKDIALLPGDVVHIPAGTPHQLKLPKGGQLLYFVVKIKEAP